MVNLATSQKSIVIEKIPKIDEKQIYELGHDIKALKHVYENENL